jgi:hypothetical protein
MLMCVLQSLALVTKFMLQHDVRDLASTFNMHAPEYLRPLDPSAGVDLILGASTANADDVTWNLMGAYCIGFNTIYQKLSTFETFPDGKLWTFLSYFVSLSQPSTLFVKYVDAQVADARKTGMLSLHAACLALCTVFNNLLTLAVRPTIPRDVLKHVARLLVS